MKKISLFSVALLIFVLIPVWAAAATVEGSVQGFNCVIAGKVCPIGKEDPMIAAERVFVVLTKDNDYYFVPNLSRGILARHINQMVRVTGKISSKYKAIQAETLEVLKKGSWKQTWSLEEERRIYWGRGGSM